MAWVINFCAYFIGYLILLPFQHLGLKDEVMYIICSDISAPEQHLLSCSLISYILQVCRQRVLHIEGGSNLAYSIDSSMFRSGSDSEVQV